jgi:hypothetical protein
VQALGLGYGAYLLEKGTQMFLALVARLKSFGSFGW